MEMVVDDWKGERDGDGDGDKSYVLVGGCSMSSATPDYSRWKIVYPIYIDEEKTYKQGRRISKEKAVKNPKCEEIAELCRYLKLPHLIEVCF